MSEYRYAYWGKRRDAAKVHILQIDHGILCRPQATDYWTPNRWAALPVSLTDDLWLALLAANTLCARCKARFAKKQGVKA